MNKLIKQIEDWERIKDIFSLTKKNVGALKNSYLHLAHQRIKEYYGEYKIEYDPLSKPGEGE